MMWMVILGAFAWSLATLFIMSLMMAAKKADQAMGYDELPEGRSTLHRNKKGLILIDKNDLSSAY